MSILCEAIISLGLSFGGICADDVNQMTLPVEDQSAWEHMSPEPVKETVVKPAVLNFPPVVIKEVTPAPPPIIIEKPAPPAPPAPKIKKINPYEIWSRQLQQSRYNIPVKRNDYINIVNQDHSLKLASLNMDSNFDAKSNKLLKPDEAEKYQTEGRYSSKPVDNSRIIGEDRFITGILETGINSQLNSADGGNIIIQTARNIFGYHGRNILIPKGSRLVCQYQSPKDQGSSRLAIKCKRILMAGHRAEIIKLNSPIGDMQGRAGINGEVYNRYGEKYGMAFLMAGISATIRGAAAGAGNSKDEESNLKAILNEGSAELSGKLGEITASILEQTVNLAPVVTVAQGTRLQIRLAHDWYISPIDKEN